MFDPRVQWVMDKVDALRHRIDDHWQIPRDEAVVLAQLVRIARARSICEIGTSYGFSTLFLAAATSEIGGVVHSFDISPKKHVAASENLGEAGLLHAVHLHLGDARLLIPALPADVRFDMLFLDAVKAESLDYLNAAWPRLNDHALIVTDNTITHELEMAPFVAHLRSLPALRSVRFPVGNGIEVSVRFGPDR